MDFIFAASSFLLASGPVPMVCPTEALPSISRRAFGRADDGDQPHVTDPPHEPSGTPTLRYLAILSAARDFGVSAADLKRVARRFHPFQTSPRELADALANLLTPNHGEGQVVGRRGLQKWRRPCPVSVCLLAASKRGGDD